MNLINGLRCRLVLMKKKILLTRRLHDFAQKQLKKKYDVTIHSGKIPMPKNILISKIAKMDGAPKSSSKKKKSKQNPSMKISKQKSEVNHMNISNLHN